MKVAAKKAANKAKPKAKPASGPAVPAAASPEEDFLPEPGAAASSGDPPGKKPRAPWTATECEKCLHPERKCEHTEDNLEDWVYGYYTEKILGIMPVCPVDDAYAIVMEVLDYTYLTPI